MNDKGENEETSSQVEKSIGNLDQFSQTEKKQPINLGIEGLMDKLDLSFNKIYQQIDQLSQRSKAEPQPLSSKNTNHPAPLNQPQLQSENKFDTNEIRQKFQVKYEQFMVMQEKKKCLKERYEQEELSQMQTTFRTSKNSEKILQKKGNHVPLVERYDTIKKKKDEKIKEQKINQENKRQERELEECTFCPTTSRGTNLIVDKRSKQDFLEFQSDWLENSKQKVVDKKLQLQAGEMEEYTYQPQINHYYKLKNMDESLRPEDRMLLQHQQSQSKLFQKRQQKEHSFQPIISPKSVELAFKKRLQKEDNNLFF